MISNLSIGISWSIKWEYNIWKKNYRQTGTKKYKKSFRIADVYIPTKKIFI